MLVNVARIQGKEKVIGARAASMSARGAWATAGCVVPITVKSEKGEANVWMRL